MRISVIIAVVAFLSVTRSADNPQCVCREKEDMLVGLGSSITVNCRYLPSERNRTKRFCKKSKGAACANIVSAHSSEHTKFDRFSLTVDKRQSLYNVSMSELTVKDAGTYRCVLESMQGRTVKCSKEYRLFIINSSKEMTSKTGDNVRILCNNQTSNHSDEEKCLCKGESPLNCSLTITKETDLKKYEFTRSSRRQHYFPVMIKNVTIADSGTYWCCNTAMRMHIQNKIMLAVDDVKEKPKSGRMGNGPTASPETKTQIDKAAGVIVSVAISLVFLALAVVALILCKHSRKRGGFSEEGRHAGINAGQEYRGDPHYEEIHPEPNDGNPGNPEITSVYACASPPADQPHYASVRFRDHPPADVSNKETLDANKDESSNTHTAEPTLYSTLKKSEEDRPFLTSDVKEDVNVHQLSG